MSTTAHAGAWQNKQVHGREHTGARQNTGTWQNTQEHGRRNMDMAEHTRARQSCTRSHFG
eukprot:5622085-Pyramimonas_sp.AAC.1